MRFSLLKNQHITWGGALIKPTPFFHYYLLVLAVHLFKIQRMIPIAINDQPYFFFVSHITTHAGNQLIYGIKLNNDPYYFSKTLGINDCKQIDSHDLLDTAVLDELCSIITEIELAYQTRPSLELINEDICQILGRIRNPSLLSLPVAV